MFKLLVALSLFVAIQGQVGGFTDRPDLLNASETTAMVRLAVNNIKDKQNLLVSPINVVSVATQLVNGINYRIVFTARSPSATGFLTCTAKVYQSFAGAQSVSSATCA
ncbi:unnamed protein product [Adineta ricciae]|uniref:Cystatin domain-containing protein n=1 Tax=Adineta ricciae TaxID=249248 RepID=A0A814REZ8_ADIRI|nr:unnamed protein product [Adineta ricciae]CAF1676217.1 unnamed protein product [Adineta ricciae]